MTAATAPAAPATRFWTPWTHKPTEWLALVAWFYIIAAPFEGRTPILYTLALYFMVGIWVHRVAVRNLLGRGWPLLILPIWMGLSYFWSINQAETAGKFLRMMLSMLLCVYMVTRFSPRYLVLAFMAAGAITAVFSLPDVISPRYAVPYGIFQHNNVLGARMVVLCFAAGVLVMDRGLHPILRFAAMGVLAVAMFNLSRSDSLTAFLTGVAGLVLLFGYFTFWRQAKGYRGLVVSVLLAAGLFGAFVVLSNPTGDLFDQFLRATNRDPTLTGRTIIWADADRLIAERPWLGVGADAFWNTPSPMGTRIRWLLYIPTGNPFNFHSAWYDAAVHTGLIGLAISALLFIWASFSMVLNFLRTSTHYAGFFVAMLAVVAPRSFVEADLFYEFEYNGMILWIGALFAVRQVSLRQSMSDVSRRWRGLPTQGAPA
jgi:exopolysaccharide production protein ExoQ